MKAVSDHVRSSLFAEFCAVGMGSFIGVTTRVGIIKSFSYAGSQNFQENGYGPFIEIFGDQKFLISNLVGCTIMAFCVANSKPITEFNAPLFKFFTTGFCGSLTTFSSWMENTSVDGIYHNFTAVITMIVIEFALTWCCYELGILIAHLGWQWTSYLEVDLIFDDEEDEFDSESSKNTKRNSEMLRNVVQENRPLMDDAAPRDVETMQYEELGPDWRLPSRMSESIENDMGAMNIRLLAGMMGSPEPRIDLGSTLPPPPRQMSPFNATATYTNIKDDTNRESMRNSFRASFRSIRTASTVRALRTMSTAVSQVVNKHENPIWFISFAITASSIWICAIIQSKYTMINRTDEKALFFSVLIAPIGAWVRWYISRMTWLGNLWPEMKLQTLLVNQVAVLLATIIQVFLHSTTWTGAIVTGIFGSLSTVSTMFAEIFSLYSNNGAFVALRYTLVQFMLAILVIQILSAIDLAMDK